MRTIGIHLGLGDNINYVPAIAKLSEKERILLPCYPHYEENIKTFYDGLDVEIFPVTGGDGEVAELIAKNNGTGIGIFSKKPFNHGSHMLEGYEQLGLDYIKRMAYNPLPDQAKKVKQIAPPVIPYAFIPEGGSIGTCRIDRKYVSDLYEFVPPQKCIMLSYADIICNATEIHCHDTSWPWLIESLPTTGKLFFHVYARPESIDTRFEELLTKKWTIIR